MRANIAEAHRPWETGDNQTCSRLARSRLDWRGCRPQPWREIQFRGVGSDNEQLGPALCADERCSPSASFAEGNHAASCLAFLERAIVSRSLFEPEVGGARCPVVPPAPEVALLIIPEEREGGGDPDRPCAEDLQFCTAPRAFDPSPILRIRMPHRRTALRAVDLGRSLASLLVLRSSVFSYLLHYTSAGHEQQRCPRSIHDDCRMGQCLSLTDSMWCPSVGFRTRGSRRERRKTP